MNSEPQRIIYASPPATVSMTDYWYDMAALDHFWIRRRFEVFKHLADPLIRNATRVAEIGCGNGVVQRQVEDHYQMPVTGFELNELALKKNISRASQLYCYDIHQRSPQFRAHFDFLLLFDVIEHIGDESAFLQSIKYHMTDSGILAINVPALQALYSKYDEAQGHFRRYSIPQLVALIERNAFEIRSLTYWGLPLVPLLMARKAVLNFRRTEHGIVSSGFDPGSSAINSSLDLLARCECLPQKIAGTSLMMIAQNQTGAG
jgi:SAM-dependent methyltransferase